MDFKEIFVQKKITKIERKEHLDVTFKRYGNAIKDLDELTRPGEINKLLSMPKFKEKEVALDQQVQEFEDLAIAAHEQYYKIMEISKLKKLRSK